MTRSLLVAVAESGSNCGTWTAEGGHGGGLTGGSGCLFSCSDCQYTGSGGTQAAGGIAGPPTSHTYCTGNTNGSFGIGGSNTVGIRAAAVEAATTVAVQVARRCRWWQQLYFSPRNIRTHTQGVRQGNGMIVITTVILSPCTSPSNVTASPPMICLGSTADMNATSAGNTIPIGTLFLWRRFHRLQPQWCKFCSESERDNDLLRRSCRHGLSPLFHTVTMTVDNVAAVANCQAITVTLDANGNASTTASAVNNGSTDNCTIASSALSQTSLASDNAGTNSVTLTVTDNNGNTATCATTISVMGANPRRSLLIQRFADSTLAATVAQTASPRQLPLADAVRTPICGTMAATRPLSPDLWQAPIWLPSPTSVVAVPSADGYRRPNPPRFRGSSTAHAEPPAIRQVPLT